MTEQDHKLSSMVNLITVLARDLQMVKSELKVGQKHPTFSESFVLTSTRCPPWHAQVRFKPHIHFSFDRYSRRSSLP